jgi:hypothetical protein
MLAGDRENVMFMLVVIGHLTGRLGKFNEFYTFTRAYGI